MSERQVSAENVPAPGSAGTSRRRRLGLALVLVVLAAYVGEYVHLRASGKIVSARVPEIDGSGCPIRVFRGRYTPRWKERVFRPCAFVEERWLNWRAGPARRVPGGWVADD